MRKIINFNDNWLFSKDNTNFEKINIPHCWNAVDGQDGGGNYYRGECIYQKTFDMPDVADEEALYIQFNGVSNSAEVLINGKSVLSHDGGFSTFRADITSYCRKNKNEIIVKVSNEANRKVYPQKADFTFYGGIYRNVSFIIVNKSHFDLDYYGGNGVKITPVIQGNDAVISVNTFPVGGYDDVIINIDGTERHGKDTEFTIKNIRLWNGIEDPYLYVAKILLIKEGKVVDEITQQFGCRNVEITENGFYLNGKSYPLRGVAKHQDRWGVGNAVTREMLEEDMRLILEVGANAVRLAHYQHDDYFYELCDKYGICVWAEIPYISQHMPEANQNTVTQMTELIIQNYNHPSIVTWGLSNEITVCGTDKDLTENHIRLNTLCKSLDKTRFTSMACAFMQDIGDSLLDIADAIGYNLYFGWYVGDTEGNGKFFDDFRKSRSNKPIGLTEYGADANLKFQTNEPEKGDYTEQYQAEYHERLLQCIEERPYLWCTFVWNMFDFGADAREEGEAHGQNRKGLVTFDRKIKKDAFYIYKAYWSKVPFVHISGSRYVDRSETQTNIKVYSNLEEVELYVDDKLIAKLSGNKIFNFHIEISGKHTIKAVAGNCNDEIKIVKVQKPNPNYRLVQSGVTNWFDNEVVSEHYFTIADTIGDIAKSMEGRKVLLDFIKANAEKHAGRLSDQAAESTLKMMSSMTFKKIIQRSAGSISNEELEEISQKLNKIKK